MDWYEFNFQEKQWEREHNNPETWKCLADKNCTVYAEGKEKASRAKTLRHLIPDIFLKLPILYLLGSQLCRLNISMFPASLGIIATPLVAVLSGPLVEYFGRKFTFYLFYILSALGFLFIGCAQRVAHIYVGRVLGASAHGVCLVSLLYIYEICLAHQRNKLLPLMCPICSGGVLYAYVIGGYLPWNTAALVLAGSAVAGLICVFFIPESPMWLIMQSNEPAAVRSLKWLKRDQETIAHEVEELKKACFDKDLPEKLSLDHFLQPTVWKPFSILLLFSVLQNGAGFYMLLYYTVNFFQDLGTGAEIDPVNITVGLAVLRLFSGSVGAVLIAKFSRKKLTATTAFGMSLVASSAATYLYTFGETPGQRPHEWFLLFCALAYVLLCTLAIQPLPWLLPNELYPPRLRGLMSGATFFCLFSIVFAGIKAYPFFVFAVHVAGILIIFAVSCIVTVLFALFVLPETLNKTPEEIEEYFRGRGVTVVN